MGDGKGRKRNSDQGEIVEKAMEEVLKQAGRNFTTQWHSTGFQDILRGWEAKTAQEAASIKAEHSEVINEVHMLKEQVNKLQKGIKDKVQEQNTIKEREKHTYEDLKNLIKKIDISEEVRADHTLGR